MCDRIIYYPTPPNGQPHAAFRGFTSICGGCHMGSHTLSAEDLPPFLEGTTWAAACSLQRIYLHFWRVPHGQPHAAFRGFISICGGCYMGSHMQPSEDLSPFVEGATWAATCSLQRIYLHLWRVDAVVLCKELIVAENNPHVTVLHVTTF